MQIFQKNNIKEINLKNGELAVAHNDKKVILEEIISKNEIYNMKDYLVKTKQNSLTAERLKELSNFNSSKMEFPLQLGDKVRIKSSRPYSRTKRFLVVERSPSALAKVKLNKLNLS